MSASDLLDSGKGNQLESGEAMFTKVNDDVNLKPNVKLIGLTKEELEKYRNDPFWKTIRYIMFILFWLIWLAMFVAAVLIVIMSPKCAKICGGNGAVNYRIFVSSYFDSDDDGVGDLVGIADKLKNLKDIGVTGIMPTPIFSTGPKFAAEEVLDLDTIDKRIGDTSQFEKLITNARDNLLCVIADLPLAVSDNNMWAKNLSGAFLAIKGHSGLLDLNHNDVTEKLLAVAKRLFEMGVDALYLTTYGKAEKKLAGLEKLIKSIRQKLNNDLIIYTEPELVDEDSKAANYTVASLSFSASVPTTLVQQVDTIIGNNEKRMKSNATGVAISDVTIERLDNTIKIEDKRKAIPVIQMVQLILPGPVNVYYGEEIGLPSINYHNLSFPQCGLMRWNSKKPTFGFSKNKSSSIYFMNAPEQDLALNFEDELENLNSQLNTFKNISKLRSNFGSNYSKTSLKSIHYYTRSHNDAKKPKYVLAVNWPTSLNSSEPKPVSMPTDDVSALANVKVKAHAPHMTNVPDVVDLQKPENLFLNTFDAVLLELSNS